MGRFSGGAVSLLGTVVALVTAFLTTVLGGYFGLQTTEKDNLAQFELKQEEVRSELRIKELEVQGQLNVAKLSAEAERERLEIQQKFEIIVQATKGLPAEDAVENLLFFVEAGILEDQDGKIAKLVEQGSAPVLPAPPAPEPAQQETPQERNQLLERKEEVLANTSIRDLFARTDKDFLVVNGVLFDRANAVRHVETRQTLRTPNKPRYIVAHYTPAKSVENVISWSRNSPTKSSTHVIIDRSGEVVQMVPFDQPAFHSGGGNWADLRNLNNASISINLINYGNLKRGENGAWVTHTNRSIGHARVVELAHKNAPGRLLHWEQFDPVQLDVARRIVAAISEEIPEIVDIIGHDDIDPQRKLDPGPAFPMEDIREAVFGRRDALPPPN